MGFIYKHYLDYKVTTDVHKLNMLDKCFIKHFVCSEKMIN